MAEVKCLSEPGLKDGTFCRGARFRFSLTFKCRLSILFPS